MKYNPFVLMSAISNVIAVIDEDDDKLPSPTEVISLLVAILPVLSSIGVKVDPSVAEFLKKNQSTIVTTLQGLAPKKNKPPKAAQ